MIYIRKLDENHYICQAKLTTFQCEYPFLYKNKRLSIGAKRFCKKYRLNPCSGAYAAFENGKVIAFLRFDENNYDSTIYAAGTYVEKKYRGNGIAKKLWNRLTKLAQKNNKPIEVGVASKGGKALVKSIKKTNNKAKIIMYEI